MVSVIVVREQKLYGVRTLRKNGVNTQTFAMPLKKLNEQSWDNSI